MAVSQAIALTAGDWVSLPDDAEFTFQNSSSSTTLLVKTDTVKPTDLEGAYLLHPGDSMNRLTSGLHWIYTDYPTQAMGYVADDR